MRISSSRASSIPCQVAAAIRCSGISDSPKPISVTTISRQRSPFSPTGRRWSRAINGSTTVLRTAGSLVRDPTFNPLASPTLANGNGKLLIDFGQSSRPDAMALAPDGGVVMVGSVTVGAFFIWAAAKTTAAGVLDPNFNGGTKTFNSGEE